MEPTSVTEAFSFSMSVPITELKVQTDKKGWHTVSVCSPLPCSTCLHNNNSRTLSYHLNLVSLASLHLTTSVTDLVLADEMWPCHRFSSSLSPGLCEDHCSSLLAHVPCWTQISFLPFNEEHLHFLLLDKTLAHDNSTSRSWQSELWHCAIPFSLPYTNPASLLTLNAPSCFRTRVGDLCFALFLPLISSVFLNSSCPGRVKG